MRLIDRLGVTADTEHFLRDRRHLRQDLPPVERTAIGDTRLQSRLAGRGQWSIDGSKALPDDPHARSIDIVTLFKHIDHGAQNGTPLWSSRQVERGLALSRP